MVKGAEGKDRKDEADNLDGITKDDGAITGFSTHVLKNDI